MFAKLFKKKKAIEIIAPVDGEIIDLASVKDEAFAGGALGQGVAIIPKSGDFVAPISGDIETAFPTGHAYGIKAEDGTGVLLHIGIDTVMLKGQGFAPRIVQGQKIRAGEPLVTVDLAVLTNANKLTETPIVVTTDTLNNRKVEIVKKGPVKKGEIIFRIV